MTNNPNSPSTQGQKIPPHITDPLEFCERRRTTIPYASVNDTRRGYEWPLINRTTLTKGGKKLTHELSINTIKSFIPELDSDRRVKPSDLYAMVAILGTAIRNVVNYGPLIGTFYTRDNNKLAAKRKKGQKAGDKESLQPYGHYGSHQFS